MLNFLRQMFRAETAAAGRLVDRVAILATPVLFALAGTSLAQALAQPALLGFGIGMLFSLPPLLFSSRSLAAGARPAEWMSLLLLFVISIVASGLILLPLLDGATAAVATNLPLLLSAVLIYLFHLLLHRLSVRSDGLQKRLAVHFSGPSMLMALIMAVTLASYLLLLLHYLRLEFDAWSFYSDKFLDRGIIPPVTVVLFFWGLLLLLGKFWVLLRERGRLLTEDERSQLMRMYRMHLDEHGAAPPQLWLDMVWKKAAEFYVVPRYINWAIPILGFIGTVLGISLAAEGIQRIIGSQEGLTQMSSDLGQAISPLGIAFDTTLIALSLSVVLTLALTLLQRWEDSLLMEYENRIHRLAATS